MATYYVKIGGSDGANGTSDGTAFATLAYALTQTAANDTILMRQGDTFVVSINAQNITTEGLTLSNYFGSNGTSNPILDQQKVGDETFNAVLLISANNVVVDGIDVHNSMGKGIDLSAQSDGCTIRNCHVNWTVLAGIQGNRADNTLIEDNTVQEASQIRLIPDQELMPTWPPAMFFSVCNDVTIRRNWVIEGQGEGIDAYNGSDGVTIEDNVVAGCRRIGIYVDTAVNITIRRNLIYYTDQDLSGDGYGEWGGITINNELSSQDFNHSIVVENNLVSGYNTGIALADLAGGDYYGCMIRNNIITQCGTGLSDTLASANVQSGGIQIYNNLFTGNLVSDSGSTSNVTKDYNCWWPAPTANGGANDTVENVVLARTSGWRDGPAVGGVVAGDFHPENGSASWNVATDAGQATDYYGNDYVPVWDIGSFDSNAPELGAPPAPTAIVHIGSRSTSGGTNPSVILHTPNGTAEGHVMVAQLSTSYGLETTWTTPAGWVEIYKDFSTNGLARNVVGYYKIVEASEPAEHAFTASGSGAIGGNISTYAGVDTANVLDAAYVLDNTQEENLTPAAPAITTATDNAMVHTYQHITGGSGVSVNAPSGYALASSLDSHRKSMGVAIKEKATFGPESPGNWTTSDGGETDRDNTLVTLALRPKTEGATPILSDAVRSPTIDGAVAECQSNSTEGSVYCGVRTDRGWQDTDEDKALLIDGTLSEDVVYNSGAVAATANPQQVIDGLAARLDPANPYYVGWVQKDGATESNLLTDSFNTLALTLDNPTKDETGDGATLTIDSNSDAGTLYSYSKTTPFTGTEAENAAEIIANGVGQGAVIGTNTRVVTGQAPLTPYYAGWVQDSDGYGADMVLVFSMDADETLTIPGSTGTYDYEVNWGDLTDPDTWEAFTTVPATHTYTGDVAGEKEVYVRGTFPHVYFNSGGDIGKLIRILNWGDTSWSSAAHSFYGATNLVEASSDVANTSSVTNMGSMMRAWSSMTSPPDLSSWDTKSVTDMGSMMRDWTSMTSPPDLSSFDTSSVTSMASMMYNWAAMTSPPDLSSFDTRSVTNMGSMMLNWLSMTSPPDLSSFDTSSVTSMSSMMYKWTSMTSPPDLSSFDTRSVTDMSSMMRDWSLMSSTPDLSSFNTSKVTSMSSMMRGWSSMGAIDIPIYTWDIGLVTDFALFLSGSKLTTACYDDTLESWGNQTLAAGAASTTIHFGTSQYSLSSQGNRDLLEAQVAGIIDSGVAP